LNSNAAYGANAAVNPNAAQAIALCSARMGAISAEYYAPGSQQPNGGSWTPFVNATGNPFVDPEEATTWTAGFVYQPDSGRPLWDGITATVDWYNIEISDMISVEPAEVVYQECLSIASNPSADPLHPACLRVNRNPGSGGAAPTTVSYINGAFAKVAGVDLTIDWRADLMGGSFGVNFMVSSLQDLKTQATSASPVIDWKGSLGPDPGTSLNNGAYDYRTFTTVNYGRNDWNLSLRWRHLPTAIDGSQAVTSASTQLGAEESYDVFDLTGTYDLSDKTGLRFGIENLFDTPPVWTGARTALDNSPSSGSGTTEAGFYDILGRQFYLGVRASF
jgi:outer membrane receptor protein involved in Fe transport